MELTRRDFIGLGKGAAAAAVLAGLGLAGTPKQARAIIGIDDALLGAVVVAIASLGGYALYNQYVGNNSLQAVGASFSDYVSVTGNREAAIQAAMAAAALHGIAGTQPDFERAGNIIANGEGAFLAALESAASTGRLALDGLVSGGDSLVGMMRELVTGWLGSNVMAFPSAVVNNTVAGTLGTTVTPIPIGVMDLGQMLSMATNMPTKPGTSSSAWMWYDYNWQNAGNYNYVATIYLGDNCFTSIESIGNNNYRIGFSGTVHTIRMQVVHSPSTHLEAGSWDRYYNTSLTIQYPNGNRGIVTTPDLLGGALLPGVDRAADAPDVIGTAWDSLPIATDMVIDPSTGDITSAGSITLPSSVPTTAGDYAAALQGALAGVVADSIALPLSLEQGVTVATPAGIATMPISEAIASETSLQLDYAPDIPIDPVLPPVDVPEGPWTPAVELPFMNVWPFNMIYTFIETMSRLGGN